MNTLWKGLGQATKLRILKACIFPLALYGCEAWTLHQVDLDRLEAFEMYCYRKILGIAWKHKVRNDKIRKIVNEKASILVNHVKK